MTDTLIERPWLAIAVFMVAMIVLEELTARDDTTPGARRIATNFSLYVFGLGLLNLIGVFGPLGSLETDSTLVAGFGLNTWLHLPWVLGLGSLFLVDSLLSYWLHRASHHFKLLWRLHAVHHTDRTLDMSTSVRHHPLETLPTFAIQLLAIVLSGATFAQAIIVGLGNSLWVLFTHAAIGRSALQFRWPMRFLVSPAFHRIHHSAEPRQTNSNFASTFAVWDWLFGTSSDPLHERVATIGLGPDHVDDAILGGQLLLPFRRLAP